MLAARSLQFPTIDASALRRAALSVLLALMIAPLPGVGRDGARAEPVDTPVCRVHLQKVEATLSGARQRFDSAADQGLEAECAAMHGQVRAMLEVRNIYRRCIDGPELGETVALMDTSIGETIDRIAARCTPRSAEAAVIRIN